MKKSVGYTLSVLLFCLLSTAAVGQKNSMLHWYFSQNNNGIFFDQNTLEPRLETIPNTLNLGQSGVASDLVTGELIFYTDGQQVYDKYHRAVTTGSGLLANPAGPQTVAVSNVPGTANQGRYYIFTNNATLSAPGSIRYSVYDTALYGAGGFPEPPVGDIDPTVKNQTIAGLTDGSVSPGMLVIPNATYDGFWLLTHQRNSETYNVTEILSDGSIGTTANYTISGAPQIVHTFTFADSSGVFPGVPTIAISPQDNRPVTLVTFDLATGAFDGAAAQFVPNTSTSQIPDFNIYDSEFSPSGQFLYISGNFNSPADSLMQVDLTDPTFPMAALRTSNSLTRSYGLQTGPDDLIYHLFETTEYSLGRINEPDSIASEAFYSRTILGNDAFISENFAAFLPLFQPDLQLDFEFSGECANSPILFFPTIKPAADSVIWDFGDGNFANVYAPIHTYTDQGTFTVTLFAFSDIFVDTVSKEINIIPFDLSISGFPPDTIVCPEDFPITLTAEASGDAAQGATFRWSNQPMDGETTTIDSAGNYYVVATANGCATYSPVRVQEYGAEEQRAFVWYFGEHAGIDFNPISTGGQPVPIPYGDPTVFNGGNEMTAPEGCAIYCDPNGFPIFYSDGSNVYDREGTLVAQLSGDPDATQSVFIMEAPSDATLYYIFTTEAIEFSGGNTFELRYSIFDLKLRNGLGDVVRDQFDIPVESTLMCNSTEKITGNTRWVIAHEYGNQLFRAFELTGQGIEAPVISQIGSVHPSSLAIAGTGYMKLSLDNKLGVALPLGSTNYIELFDFVDSIGVIENFRQMDVNADFNVSGNIYGLEFSQDGSKIFGSLNGGSQSHIVEYWLDSLDNPVPQDQFDTDLELGALQLGPTGSIYVANNGQQFLGTIFAPGDSATEADYQESGFALSAGTSSNLGLPNFSSQYGSASNGSSLQTSNGCPGDEILFVATGTSPFDEYIFNVTRLIDGAIVETSSTYGPAQTAEHTFSTDSAGNYEVSVFIFNQCSNSPDTTLVQPFTVFAPPSFDLASTDASACGSNDGSVEVTINFTGAYHYTIRNTSGQILDAGFDVTDPILSLDSLPGGVYTVFIQEQTNGCINSDNITVNEDQAFQITNVTTQNTDCEGEGGGISFSVDNNAVPPINYTIYNSATNDPAASGTTNQLDTTITNLIAGTYYLELTDQNTCSDFATDLIITPPDTVTLLPEPTVSACGVAEITLRAESPDAQRIIWSYGNNTVEADSIVVDQPGTYFVTAEGDGVNNCDNTKEVTVIFNDASPNPFREMYTICPQDPIVENSVVKLFPGRNFIRAEYFDEDGDLITENTPGFDFSGDTLLVFTLANIRAELTNAFGCVTEAEIAVIESCDARISVPNAFRPASSNEMNTTFRVFSSFIDEDNFQIIIFNRWGEIVFESEDPNFRWNGGMLGDVSQPLPQGTYAYIIRFISEFNPGLGVQTERGAVVLLR
ncbi:MAG: gliding motility-associated C-terminal domain-containing protein [Candidatus Cyclobacteriaceae bacterium M2_1C_046]